MVRIINLRVKIYKGNQLLLLRGKKGSTWILITHKSDLLSICEAQNGAEGVDGGGDILLLNLAPQ